MRLQEFSPIKAGEQAVVVGAAASGLAAARLLRLLDAKVRLLDKKEFSPAVREEAAALGIELISGEHSPEQFADAALVVPSPGVPMRVLEPLLAQAGNPDCISELELASRFTPESILAVTGTSGKTTTVSLMAAMLEEAGKKVFLGGNIGTPLSDYVIAREKGAPAADVLVLEVSSFQLQGCRDFHPHVAVFLNFSENHLDQHKDLDEYRESKFKLFSRQNSADVAIFGQELFEATRGRSFAARVEYFSVPLHPAGYFESKLLGRHNQANMQAACLAVKEYGVTEAQARSAALKFAPMPHRLERVGEWGGVLYVNDSKCTTIEALKVALESFERPVLLMAGGVFKGGDLEGMIPLLKEKAKAVGLFGASREVFESAWKNALPVYWDADMAGSMRRLRALAESGDVILLAPATSSFDLYANYKERGNDFKRLAETANTAEMKE